MFPTSSVGFGKNSGVRATRMLSLLLQLQVRGQVGAAELAQRLEVSERTVQRDVEALVGAGIPVVSVRGPAGGYKLEGRYQTRLTGVAAEEAQALAFLGLAGAAGQLGLEDVLGAARTKLFAAMTGEARQSAERTMARFHLDTVRWYGTAEPVPLLGSIAEAVWRDRRARAVYVRDGKPQQIELDPLGLVLAAGDWYLVGRREGHLRTYRVSRFSAVDVLDEPAQRPEGFDLSTHWAHARRELEAREELLYVTLRARGSALARLRRVVAVSGQAALCVNETAEWVEVTVPFEGENWAISSLLGLGAQVEVLAPAGLRQRVAGEVAAVAGFYGRDGALAGHPGDQTASGQG